MPLPKLPSHGRGLLCGALFIAGASASGAGLSPAARAWFNDSIVAVPANAPAPRPHVVRQVLSAEELAAPLDFFVSLRMRDFQGLEGRIQAGQTVPQAEMEARYLPLAADYERVASWLASEGFTLTLRDRNHTNVFARASVARISSALGAGFARVATRDGEFTSAVTAPSLPGALSAPVLSINGLQPHLRARHPRHGAAPAAGLGSPNGAPTPLDIAYAYNVPSNLTGAGQTIAIICDVTPLSSDLTQFWSICGISQSLSNFTVVNVGSGSPATGDQLESTMDVEWASSIAPAAKIRFYAIPNFAYATIVTAAAQILNDLPQNPAMLQVSISLCGPEDYAGTLPTLRSFSQTYAQLAAAGVTVLICSGDGGSNPDSDASVIGYGTSNPLSVEYPASDSNVTAVGGTTLSFNANWTPSGETTWFTTNPPGLTGTAGTGGGTSAVFLRPSWQVGTGVPSGTYRCVPDVAAQANSGFEMLNGQQYTVWGTSLATPIWAGVTALANQSRAILGIGPVGVLARQLYPMIGSKALNDITTGGNGAYSAGVGYDLCTGVGSPNVANLITLLDRVIAVTALPAGTVNAGSAVTMGVSALGGTTYQWQLNGGNIPGATGSSYSIPEAGAADNGAYAVVITSALGSLAYDVGSLATVSDARIINLSARADVQTGGNILIAGFVVSGSGQKSVLIRGIGPALGGFGVPGALAAPVLTLYNSASVAVATNTAWGGGTQLTGAMSRLGAFALPAASLDTALLQSFGTGPYTAQVAGSGNSTGVALAELYDADTGIPTARLINISARADVQTGANSLIAGFVIGAGPTNADETVLIRGIGPALSAFGVPGALTSPVLTLFDSQGAVIATSTGWSSNPVPGASPVKAGIEMSTAATLSAVGAFSLASGSADAAMTVTLPPGNYTAQVSGSGSSMGVGLVEVYEVR